jgi:peptidoglycan hydrolase CwlO-like protein
MKKAILNSSAAVIILMAAIMLTSCSAQETTKKIRPEGEKSLSFHEYKNGEATHYEVFFNRNNEIAALYLNGKQIPEDELKQYEDIVNDKIDELRGTDTRMRGYLYKSGFDSKEHREKMKELKKNLPDRTYFFHDGRDTTFRKEMEKLRQDLSENKKYFRFHWNDSTFKEGMKLMNKDLAKLKDLKIDFNPEPLKLMMKSDRDQLRKDMESLKESIRKMKEEIRELRQQMKRNQADQN